MKEKSGNAERPAGKYNHEIRLSPTLLTCYERAWTCTSNSLPARTVHIYCWDEKQIHEIVCDNVAPLKLSRFSMTELGPASSNDVGGSIILPSKKNWVGNTAEVGSGTSPCIDVTR